MISRKPTRLAVILSGRAKVVARKKQMPRRRQRLYFGIFSVIIIAFASYITLTSLDENLQFFVTPSEMKAAPTYARTVRLGGYVQDGSLVSEGVDYRFNVTDFEHDIAVEYSGFLPSLFREGQGVVAIGVLQDGGVFAADKILAKHDENYMPPEIAEKLGHVRQK